MIMRNQCLIMSLVLMLFAATSQAVFNEADGLIVMEAENYDGLRNSETVLYQSAADTLASGGQYMYFGDSAVDTFNAGNWGQPVVDGAARLDYEIKVVTGGTYYLWARGYDNPGNSWFVGVDGLVGTVRLTGAGDWTWWKGNQDVTGAATITLTPGSHTLNVYRREDQCGLDKLILAVASTYTPTGFGPDETNRGLAHTPVPANGASLVDPATVTGLSWSSPDEPSNDPNLVVTGYDVWFGTAEPNELSDTPVFTTSQSYPVSLAYDTTYYWRVDTHATWDSNEITGNFTEIIEGQVWRFTALPTFALTFGSVITTMDLLPAQLAATLSGNPAAIAGASIQFTLLQDDYQFPADANAVLTPTTTVNTNPTATLTTNTPGTYKVKLAVSDGGSKQVESTVQVRVYSDACAAKKAAPSGWVANYYDRDSNCSVSVSDLAVFAAQWLKDTSMTAQATDTGDSGYPGI
jgi:hypothetical protein